MTTARWEIQGSGALTLSLSSRFERDGRGDRTPQPRPLAGEAGPAQRGRVSALGFASIRSILIVLLLFSFVAGAVAQDPEEAQYNVVVTLYNAGQWQAAIKKIEEREKLTLADPMRAKYLCAKGLAYEKGEKSELARTIYEELIAKYPQAPEVRAARISLAHLEYAAGNFAAVIKNHAAIDKTGLADADKKNLALMYAESSYLTLADCLLESEKPREAEPYLAKAEKLAATLPTAERDALLKQIAVVKLRQSLAGGSRKEMIATITKSRDSIPADQLSRLLYTRLFALSEEGEDAAIERTMKDDYPIFKKGAEDGPATLIYFAALRKLKRQDEGLKLLEGLVARKANAPESYRARLELANVALEKQQFEQAAVQLEALRLAAGPAEAALGKETFHKVLFNRAVAAEKLGKPDDAIATLNQLIAATPAKPMLGQSHVLLGQMYAVKSDYKNAADTWSKALALGGVPEADLRDRLAHVLAAAKDHAGAIQQFEAETKLLGNRDKLSRESLEIWARMFFAAGQFAPAAALSEELYQRFRGSPAYAYECAVAREREGKLAEAAKWFAIARKSRDKLPAAYADAVDANLANVQMQSGAGDLGAAHWTESLASTQTNDAVFETFLAPLRKIAVTGKLNPAARSQIEAVMKQYNATQPRYYLIGALLLQGLSASGKTAETGKLAAKLAAEFSANESKLDPKSTGATLAPAIIYFFNAESKRLAGNPADALAAYETVLSAYPYNEWPDAAGYGAAECYAALGDQPTALAKFTEVVTSASNTNTPASAPWGELAKKRINELNKRD